MSHPTLRSALNKRKADGDSLTDGRKKNRLQQFAIEDVLVPKPSLRRRPKPSLRQLPTLLRDKSYYDKEDDNFSDKVNIDPTVSIPQDKQGPTNAIQSHHEKTLKIKVIDATNTIFDKIMEVDYDDTVTGLKKEIIRLFLNEETLHPRRIHLTLISCNIRASTSLPSDGHLWIRENTPLRDFFGGEPNYHSDGEGDVKVHVKVQILPSPKQI
jgi:hypothetical protein